MRQSTQAPSVRAKAGTVRSGKRLPVIVEKGSDGHYVVECPLFEGCYTRGRTIDEALRNIREVIDRLLSLKIPRDAELRVEEFTELL